MVCRLRFPLPILLAVCASGLLPAQGRAQTQAFDFVPGVTRFDFTSPAAASWAVGYEFTINANVPVYNLGFYDSGTAPRSDPGSGTTTSPDGFTASHEVGIYNAIGGALLVQALVPQFSTLLDSNFRYADQLEDASGNTINGPYTLLSGGTYIIAGVSHGENYTYVQNPQTELTHDLHVAYLHSFYQPSVNLALPRTQDAAGGYFGPNFTTSSFNINGSPSNATTPEPGAAAFGICAVVAGLLWRAKRLRPTRPASSCS